MTRNLSDKPHKTPHPDQPHSIGPAKERNAPVRPPSDEADPEVPSYDSCFDDLNRLLASAVNEPDPNLASVSPQSGPASSAAVDESVTGVASDRGRQPRTSEVFQAVGPSVIEASSATASRHTRPESVPSSESTETLARVELTPADQAATHAETDDHLNAAPFPWTHVVLLAYSSALTMALIWALWQGWLQRPRATEGSAELSSTGVEAALNAPEFTLSGPMPPIPAENLAKLGQTIRIGELEVTPLSITRGPVTRVRSIEPSIERVEEEASLILRLRFTNVSKDQTFAPIERGMLRAPSSPRDQCYIDIGNERAIGSFPLAVDSEWSIVGQDFPELKPRESAETIIASAPASIDQVSAEMTWRVRLRVGSYRTDLMAARFTKEDVLPTPMGTRSHDRDCR